MKPDSKNYYDLVEEGDQAVIDHILSYLFYLRESNIKEGDLGEVLYFYKEGSFWGLFPDIEAAPLGGLIRMDGQINGEPISMMFEFAGKSSSNKDFMNVDLRDAHSPPDGRPLYPGPGRSYNIFIPSNAFSSTVYKTINIRVHSLKLRDALVEKIYGHISQKPNFDY